MMIVVIVVRVPPVPVFLLVVLIAIVELAMVAMSFSLPLLVIHGFVIVPTVVVAVIGIVVAMFRTARRQQGRGERKRTDQISSLRTQEFSPPPMHAIRCHPATRGCTRPQLELR